MISIKFYQIHSASVIWDMKVFQKYIKVFINRKKQVKT